MLSVFTSQVRIGLVEQLLCEELELYTYQQQLTSPHFPRAGMYPEALRACQRVDTETGGAAMLEKVKLLQVSSLTVTIYVLAQR